jgi:hypothetical protein
MKKVECHVVKSTDIAEFETLLANHLRPYTAGKHGIEVHYATAGTTESTRLGSELPRIQYSALVIVTSLT